ncbi:MAG: hypothetical protein JO056_11640 [Alphaproteobacteria bacterium]|nr:hypothetical protein [Alphaproteobacteria bacterium]
MRRFAVLLLASAVGGCTSVGTKFDESKVDSFKVGQTNCAEAVMALGRPSQDMRSANGERTVLYMYSDMRMRPETFLPYIGPLVGGMDNDTKSLSLICDRRGVLKDYSVSTGGMDMNQNLAR